MEQLPHAAEPSLVGDDVTETTVLVHGLWVHGSLMTMQQIYLRRMGFSAICYSYPSMRLNLTDNVTRLAGFALSLSAQRIHWVGHSLGGQVILRMLTHVVGLPPGRVVLIGVPYRSSYAVRSLAQRRLGATALGHSMREWLQCSPPMVPTDREIGVIAGSSSLGVGALVTPGLPSPNDGATAVEETNIPGAKDHVVLSVSHTGMLFSRIVARQIGAFLVEGAFAKQNTL